MPAGDVATMDEHGHMQVRFPSACASNKAALGHLRVLVMMGLFAGHTAQAC